MFQAEDQVKAQEAALKAKRQQKSASEQSLAAEKDLESYLRISSPFSGVVTERLIHPGALVGPGPDPVFLVVQQVSHLRLVVAVPEQYVGGIAEGARVDFRVPASTQRTYSGTVARAAHSWSEKTRTMAVEVDVLNANGSLSPGMYASVEWPLRRDKPSLLAPKTSVVTTTERTFVIRSRDGHAEWVNVVKGAADGDAEVFGNLQAGALVVRLATDEIRDGAQLARSTKNWIGQKKSPPGRPEATFCFE